MFEKPPKGSDFEAENRRRETGIIHNSGMYDMGEDMYGNTVNEATGKKYKDTDHLDKAGEEPHFEVVETLESVDERAGDEADRWLQENDPDVKKD